MLSICAVIAARNEYPYLRVLLPILASQNIDVVVIDNESTDESKDLYHFHRNNPVISVEDVPFRGYFSLSEQLEAKQKVISRIQHDWVVHHDADEIFEHSAPGLNLRDAIQEADTEGFNVLNFDEFVFLPEPNASYQGTNYYREMLRYYFFEPQKNRLNRAWKRSIGLNNTSGGGHRLSGAGISIFPENHVLRHYIILSYEHAKHKYLNRTFSTEDLSRGWHQGPHGDRLHFTEKKLLLPHDSPYLFQLDRFDSKQFRKDFPSPKHFWLW